MPAGRQPRQARATAGVVAPPPVVYLAPDANPDTPLTALATDGPYRFSRNPAYIGMANTYVGITLAAEPPWALVMLSRRRRWRSSTE